MTLQHIDILDIVFQLIAFLFAISVHESAHAWMANLRGDPTARMLGRISLNPIKHIDPVRNAAVARGCDAHSSPVLGWAKPTPVDPRNFKNPVLDDILTSVVGTDQQLCGRNCGGRNSASCKARYQPLGQQIVLRHAHRFRFRR